MLGLFSRSIDAFCMNLLTIVFSEVLAFCLKKIGIKFQSLFPCPLYHLISQLLSWDKALISSSIELTEISSDIISSRSYFLK